MKIIDLLNKIANGEEVPIEIEFNNTRYIFNNYCNQYYEKEKGTYFSNKLTFENSIELKFYGDYLNDEVKIIEENKPIEELKIEIKDTKNKLLGNSGTEYTIRVIDKILINKINELVKEVNKLEDE